MVTPLPRVHDFHDQPSLVLKAANHRVIGKSEMCDSQDAMENGIALGQERAGRARRRRPKRERRTRVDSE